MGIVRTPGTNNLIKITAHQGFSMQYKTDDVSLVIEQQYPDKDVFDLVLMIKEDPDILSYRTNKEEMVNIILGIQSCCQAMCSKLHFHSLKELPKVEEAKV